MMRPSGNNPLFAWQCLLSGAKYLGRPELRAFVLAPLALNLLLYALVLYLGLHYLSPWIQHLIPAWLSWLDWLIRPLLLLVFLALSFFSFTLVANLLAAPYYGRLCAKTSELLSGRPAPAEEIPWRQAFAGEIKRLGYLGLRALPLLLLTFIPAVNLVAAPAWALFAAWGVAMEFFSYPLEARGMAFDEQKQFLQRNRIGSLSFGAAGALAMTVPLLNLLAAQAAVVGATVYVQRLLVEEGWGDD